ncbi:MAG: START domain-containing protein [Chitinophagaceae bacterium]
MLRYFLLLPLLVFALFCEAQDNWTLKTDKEGIAVYMKSLENSKLKVIRVICTLPATPAQLVAVILDVNTGAEWVYSTKSSVLLKKVSPSELYYYSEVSVPWPVSNRDFVSHLIATQDPVTKVVTIDGPTLPNYIPPKDGIVRVGERSSGKWVITARQPRLIHVEYTLQVDPAGSLPAWLVNLFAAKGPFETFKNLKEQLKKPAYANVKLPFIVD